MEKIKRAEHLEYSLGLAVIIAIGLPFCNFSTTTPTLLGVNVVAIISILRGVFSVICHDDVLVH
jgi:hypothetical protein